VASSAIGSSSSVPFRPRDLTTGLRLYVRVDDVLVRAEVVYVRPKSAGKRRVMLRRLDTQEILEPRALSELVRAP
jgi:hypothetical protein